MFRVTDHLCISWEINANMVAGYQMVSVVSDRRRPYRAILPEGMLILCLMVKVEGIG